jgi:hypothetical protein
MKLSPGRLRWLETLERELIARRGRGRIGYDCMHDGLTEWAILVPAGCSPIFPDDRIITSTEERLKVAQGILRWGMTKNLGETLTLKGRLALRDHRAANASGTTGPVPSTEQATDDGNVHHPFAQGGD